MYVCMYVCICICMYILQMFIAFLVEINTCDPTPQNQS